MAKSTGAKRQKKDSNNSPPPAATQQAAAQPAGAPSAPPPDNAAQAAQGKGVIVLPPMLEPFTGSYCPRHVDIRLDGPQADALRRLAFSLQADGVPINRGTDAIRWLLNQIPRGA